MTGVPDVLVIGGGAIGLTIALELKLKGASVTVLSRDFAQAASHAAAGMLAPQAEQIPPGAMLELCLQSRDRYPDWIGKLESITGIDTGYWACGILAPVLAEKPNDCKMQNATLWLDRLTIHHHQAGLSPEVIGGWWYPQDGQVDNRCLTQALWIAAQTIGVKLEAGVTVEQVLHDDRQVTGLQTSSGDRRAGHYVLATGAWSQDLLPVPVFPRKGQMLSVRATEGQPLQTVLFGDQVYIVPRRDGRIVIGATSEDVGFVLGNTAERVRSLHDRAIRLFPALQDFPVQESWWGFRPATADEQPILGASPYANLTLATGHYRNGILLTPITAELIADWIVNQSADPLLSAFHWSRFKP
jgi:thiazole synthase